MTVILTTILEFDFNACFWVLQITCFLIYSKPYKGSKFNLKVNRKVDFADWCNTITTLLLKTCLLISWIYQGWNRMPNFTKIIYVSDVSLISQQFWTVEQRTFLLFRKNSREDKDVDLINSTWGRERRWSYFF